MFNQRAAAGLGRIKYRHTLGIIGSFQLYAPG